MLNITGNVHYTDGSVVPFAGGIVAISRWEQYAQRTKLDPDPSKSPMTWQLYIAYACLGSATGADGFDTWRDKVLHVDLEVDDANPTDQGTPDA